MQQASVSTYIYTEQGNHSFFIITARVSKTNKKTHTLLQIRFGRKKIKSQKETNPIYCFIFTCAYIQTCYYNSECTYNRAQFLIVSRQEQAHWVAQLSKLGNMQCSTTYHQLVNWSKLLLSVFKLQLVHNTSVPLLINTS